MYNSFRGLYPMDSIPDAAIQCQGLRIFKLQLSTLNPHAFQSATCLLLNY